MNNNANELHDIVSKGKYENNRLIVADANPMMMVLKLQTHSIESWVADGCVVVGTYGINKLVEYGLLPENYYCDHASPRMLL